MRVLITSGGTLEKVDDVRVLTNFSQGTTGALLAEEFLRQGHMVYFVTSKNGKRPFRHRIRMGNDEGLAEADERLSLELEKTLRDCRKYEENLKVLSYETFEEYKSIVHRVVRNDNRPIDVVILAAAVSDYSVDPYKGKMSSDEEVITIDLKRNPKVISMIKEWNPKTFLVGFKLLSKTPYFKLIETAYAHGRKNRSDLTVANLVDKDNVAIITPEKGVTTVKRQGLVKALVEMVSTRAGTTHFHTDLVKGEDWKHRLAPEVKKFANDTKKLFSYNLFPAYSPEEEGDRHFGFFAQRVKEGFLISGRGSNKRKLHFSNHDLVLVTGVDEMDLYVKTQGGKASLNANVAAKIFNVKPEVNVILHSHADLGFDSVTERERPPGTMEDAHEVMKAMGDGCLVQIPNHGVIIAGKTVDELIKLVGESHVYRNHPELYDVVYDRFQRSDDFLWVVTNNSKPPCDVLDLACGTGNLAEQLKRKGYRVSLADRSEAMLAYAKGRMIDATSMPAAYVASMDEFDLPVNFDVIVVRQAINYMTSMEKLVKAFKCIHKHLRPNGVFLFNAPTFTPETIPPEEKPHTYTHGDWRVRVREMNVLDGNLLTHTQQCFLCKEDGSEVKNVYDLNRFALYTKEEFEKALQEAGFKQVAFFGKDRKKWDPSSKSLYGIGKRC